MPKPKIDFCFQGWVRGAEVDKAFNVIDGAEVDVSEMPADELVKKLQSGELSVSMMDLIDEGDDSEREIFDYSVHGS